MTLSIANYYRIFKGLVNKRAANKGKDPARGGARKVQDRAYSPAQKEQWVDRVRQRWAALANAALEQAQCAARIDHRSLQAQRQEQEQLAEQARERGDELAAARHQRAALDLCRPPQPKRGRVLEYAAWAAPDRSNQWRRYKRSAEKLKTLRNELSDVDAAIAEQKRRIERGAAAKAELEASHGWQPDRMVTAQMVLAAVLDLGQAHRQDVARRWDARRERRQEAEELRRERRREKIVDGWVWRRKTRPSFEIQDRWDFRKRQRQELREAEEFFAREERDRVTEQGRQPGIRHPDKPRWQVERERILTEVYGEAVAERLGRWFRIEQRGETLVLKNSAAEVTDHGDRVTAVAGNEREIEVMIALARAKGWETVTLTGSQDFQERAAQAFLKAGISIFDKELESRVLARTQTQDDVSLPFQWDLHQEAGELDIGNRSPHGMENVTVQTAPYFPA
ncbi:MAG: LPD7 domain-containing protein [Acidithiobacillus caldus]|uniref:LPD7 domain-containing protein n=1 Tax=Acidithiobacillus caldus TaxID=33059 RepID=UPI0028152CF2|nr:LPD7 domain-containing protein [Acidithiobacillus caldus]WMT47161.1 MAG: LPD7 domain-containing protein [Acidithiobacillus caldus]